MWFLLVVDTQFCSLLSLVFAVGVSDAHPARKLSILPVNVRKKCRTRPETVTTSTGDQSSDGQAASCSLHVQNTGYKYPGADLWHHYLVQSAI